MRDLYAFGNTCNKNEGNRYYEFDKVFNTNSSNKQIYEKNVKKLIKPIFNGFNATVFAYGVTGSGKTYTMFGKMVKTFVNRG